MALSFFQKLALKKFVKKYFIALPFALDNAKKIGFCAWLLEDSMTKLLSRPYINHPDRNRYFSATKEARALSRSTFCQIIGQKESVVEDLVSLTDEVIQSSTTLKDAIMIESNELPYFPNALETKNRLSRIFEKYDATGK
jgi:hypothetical protein